MKATKRVLALLLAVMMIMGTFSLGFTAAAATKKVTKITLSQTKKTIYIGDKFTLTAKVAPSNATNKSVSWYSTDESIAIVNSKGTVKGLKAGTVSIICKAKDKSGVKATCKLTVKPVSVTKITLSEQAKTVSVDEKFTLTAKISPSNATNKGVKWYTSDSDIVAVNSKGTVKGISAGTATITCKAKDGSGKKATCTVTVKATPVKKIVLSETSKTVYAGESFKLYAEVLPSNASNKNVKWYLGSGDSSIASVSSSGTVTARNPGTINIVCKAKDGSGKKATCQLTVLPVAVTGISLSQSERSTYIGDKFSLTANVYPANATNKSVRWYSENTSVASVSANGNVQVFKQGTVNIVCESVENSTIKAVCKLTVHAQIEVSMVGVTNDIGFVDRQTTVVAKTEVKDSNDPTKDIFNTKGIKFESENPNIATITLTSSSYKASPVYGVIRFNAPGKTRIRAVTLDGSVASDWINVTVKGLVVEKTFYDNMTVGKSVQINAYISDGTKLNENVIYTAGVYSEYLQVTLSGNVKVIKALPSEGVCVTVMDESGNLSKQVWLSGASSNVPSSSTGKAALLNQAKNYSVGASRMKECYMTKDIAYTNTKVSSSSVDMTSSNLLVLALIKAAASDLGNESADELVNDLFSGTDSQYENIKGSDYPVLSLSDSDVKSITVKDNGEKTFEMTINLYDTQQMALADVSNSSYAKAMPVLDKAYLDNYIKTIQKDVVASMGDEAEIKNISYGTVKEKYSGGYVVLTVDKISNKITETECHFKTDMNVANALLDMTVYMDLTGSGKKTDITMKTKASFTTTIEETISYKFIKY